MFPVILVEFCGTDVQLSTTVQHRYGVQPRKRSKYSSAAVSRGATIGEGCAGCNRYIRDIFVIFIYIRKAWIYLLLLLLLLLLKFCQKYIYLGLDRTVLGGTARLRTMDRILYFTSPVYYGMLVDYEEGRH